MVQVIIFVRYLLDFKVFQAVLGSTEKPLDKGGAVLIGQKKKT